MTDAGRLFTLASATVEAEIDPGRGCDILTLRRRPSGVNVLFTTPWRAHADAIRAGDARPMVADSQTMWMEQYRGGWQTLFPNAGPERVVDGAAVGFHGEASTAAWRVLDRTGDRALLALDLFTVPVTIHRAITVHGDTLRIRDRLTNLSDAQLSVDYCSHPALGGEILDTECIVEVAADAFTLDPGPAGHGGTQHRSTVRTGESVVELDRVPGPPTVRGVFGWFSGFRVGVASIVNPRLRLAVRLEWDADMLPYAWLWQELNASAGFPWFGRARVMAIEPASIPTGGPARAQAPGMTISAAATVEVTVAISLVETEGRQE